MSKITPTIVGLIPARGNSKGIPGKNIIDVGGRHLIEWTIKAALDSKVFERVIVSTDSNEIAEIAVKAGAEVPFLRPAEFSGDTSASIEVVRHCLETVFTDNDYEPDYLMLLQPTSPFRRAIDIQQISQYAIKKNLDSVVSIMPVNAHPDVLFKMTASGKIEPYNSNKPTRRQDFDPVFAPNGAIYLIKTKVLKSGGDWYSSDVFGYIMDEEYSLDIDNQWDLKLARLIFNDKSV